MLALRHSSDLSILDLSILSGEILPVLEGVSTFTAATSSSHPSFFFVPFLSESVLMNDLFHHACEGFFWMLVTLFEFNQDKLSLKQMRAMVAQG